MSYTNGLDNPELYMQVKLYTGNDTNDTAITLDGDTNMQPDLVWIKSRDNTEEHMLTDSVRPINNYLASDNSGAEDSDSDNMQSLDSDGFSVGTRDTHNSNAIKYVAWCWKESATAGFDIVSFTGNVTNRTISHSLSAVPKVMIVKNREASESWVVYHASNTSAPETDYLILNATNATADGNTTWNDTAPTSSVFTVSTSPAVNGDGEGMIMYLWSQKQGYSKFGSYTGNGNADGPFVYTGFRPAYVMMKRTDSSGYHWEIWDNKRDSFNLVDLGLTANQNVAEFTETFGDFVSNGFKIRGTNTNKNGSGGTYIYMAFAEAPFVNSNGVPCNAR